jgi:hypothetical protein
MTIDAGGYQFGKRTKITASVTIISAITLTLMTASWSISGWAAGVVGELKTINVSLRDQKESIKQIIDLGPRVMVLERDYSKLLEMTEKLRGN